MKPLKKSATWFTGLAISLVAVACQDAPTAPEPVSSPRFQVQAPDPSPTGQLTSITFFINHADCGDLTGQFVFSLNGANLGSAGTTVGCECNSQELVVTFTGQDATNAWNPSGQNTLIVQVVGSDVAVGYIRVEVETTNETGTFALFDAIPGGDASNRNLCSGFVFGSQTFALTLGGAVETDVINLNFASVATGVDNGPQDGIFDSFTSANLGSVNNNGFTSFRTAFEFSLSDLPTASTINLATLTVVLSNFEGTRSIEVHGYAGDGTVQLSDFALNGLVGTASVSADGTQAFSFDVTSFMTDLAATGGAFAGFNVREEPANASNFTVMNLELTGVPPVLTIVFSTERTERIVDIDIKPGSDPNSINLGSNGGIPVAILTTDDFDAADVDPATVTLGNDDANDTSVATRRNGSLMASLEDVDNDGDLDLILHFDTQALVGNGDLDANSTELILNGATFGGQAIQGSDSVNIVP